MFKKRLAACLVATAFGAVPALAQSTNSSQPTSMNASSMFYPNQVQGQHLASNLIGTNVYSSNNESIGEINDILLDTSGQAVAAVIGVGGFLGIGEKDVAIPFRSLNLSSYNSNVSSSSSILNSTGTGSNNTGVAHNNSSNNSAASNSAAVNNSSAANMNRVVLPMSRADLQNAPTFQALNDSAAKSSTGATGTTGNRPNNSGAVNR